MALLMPLPFAVVSRTDLLGHFLLFGVMTVAVAMFARRRREIVILGALTILYGVALEYTQGYVPNRTFDLADAFANIVGGLVGTGGALLIHRFAPSKPSSRPSASSAPVVTERT